MKRLNDKAGFTLLEITLTAAVLVVLAKFTVDALQGLRATTTNSTTKVRIQQSGEEALLAIIADLNSSGFVTGANAEPYPFLFDDGVTNNAAFQGHDHVPAVHHAVVGDPDFGPSREIVFLRPADANGDEIPDVDPATGKLSFGAQEFSYVLVTDARGRNVLERRTNGANGVPVAYDVERVRFDDSATSGQHQPTNSIRVRIWYRALDASGVLQRFMSDATVRLRNGENS
jgi:hypothetical protein